MDNPLWQYSLDVYRREGVEPLLLKLQDECGLDVNVLLYAAWLGGQGIALTEAHCGAVLQATEEWRSSVVTPLRELRRQLRGIDAAEAVRERVKGLELESEAEVQRLLYESYCSAYLTPDGGTVAGNLTQAAAAGQSAPDAPSQSLLDALASLLTV